MADVKSLSLVFAGATIPLDVSKHGVAKVTSIIEGTRKRAREIGRPAETHVYVEGGEWFHFWVGEQTVYGLLSDPLDE